jgi:hypothetical protein
MKSSKILNLFTSLLFMCLGAVMLAPVIGVSAFTIGGVLAAASFIPMPSGVALMAIQKEIWIKDVVENLYRRNPFMNLAKNADEYVLMGKVVHIPNAGSQSNATRNRSSLPATVQSRTEVDITFSLDEFTTDPVLVQDTEKVELSFDKRRSVIGNHIDYLAQLVGDWMLYNWAPAATSGGFIKTTSGGTSAAYLADATGVRKLPTLADFKQFKKLMDAQNIPANDRYCQLDAYMYDQFTDLLTTTQYTDFSRYFDAENGVAGKLFGFTFLEPRAVVLRYNVGRTARIAPGATQNATDQAAGLFWQKDAVIKAVGETKIFDQVDNPTYYGDLISALVRAGGRIGRNDSYGVWVLAQETYT